MLERILRTDLRRLVELRPCAVYGPFSACVALRIANQSRFSAWGGPNYPICIVTVNRQLGYALRNPFCAPLRPPHTFPVIWA